MTRRLLEKKVEWLQRYETNDDQLGRPASSRQMRDREFRRGDTQLPCSFLVDCEYVAQETTPCCPAGCGTTSLISR